MGVSHLKRRLRVTESSASDTPSRVTNNVTLALPDYSTIGNNVVLARMEWRLHKCFIDTCDAVEITQLNPLKNIK